MERELWQPFADRGLILIGVNPRGTIRSGSSEQAVRRFVRDTGATFPIAWDNDNSYTGFPGPRLTPYSLSVVVGPGGVVAHAEKKVDVSRMRSVIEGLLP